MKEETKKRSVKKTAPKKTTSSKKSTEKKTVRKTVPKKVKEEIIDSPILNETTKSEELNQEVTINTDTSNLLECKYCHQKYEKGYTICPHCHKRQGNSIGLSFFIIFAVCFLFGIISFHFIDKYIIKKTNDTDYKDTCILVDYENLVRKPKDYKGKDVKVIGEVVKVEGYDTGYGNEMIITINANLFEGSAEHLITIDYSDNSYEQGFIEGDIITVYGKYNSINGNMPNIEAKYIVFGK